MRFNKEIISGLAKILFFSSEQNDNKKISKLRGEYIILEETKRKIENRQGKILEKLQYNCPHYHIAQIGTNDYQFIKRDMSRRICETCGYEEYGWPGKGYEKLKSGKTIRNVNKEEFNKYRIPFIA